MQKRIIISALITVLVILLSLGIISYFSVDNSIRHSLEERSELAVILASYTDYLLQSSLTRLYDISLANSVDINDKDWKPEQAALKTAYQYSIFTDGIFLLTLKGDIVATYPPYQMPKMNLLGNPYVRTAIEERRSVISNIYSDPVTNRRVIFVLVPFKNRDGVIQGLVGGEINPTNYFLNNIIRAVPTDRNTIIELVDGFGYVIASNNPVRVFACNEHNKVLGNLIAAKKQAVMECHRCHDRETERKGLEENEDVKTTDMLALIPLTEAPWGVCLREPKNKVFAPSAALGRKFIILGLISTGSALLFAFGMSRSIVNPVKSLIAAANKIADGNLSEPVKAYSRDEIGILGETFEKMRARLAESVERTRSYNIELEKMVDARTGELRESRQRLSLLLNEVIEAQEDERKRVARELHDEISQSVAALGMSIDIAIMAHAEGNLTLEGISELKRKVEQVLDGINLIIKDLRPPVLDDLGFESAVRWLLETHLGGKGINYYLVTSNGFKQLMNECSRSILKNGKTELVLFRVIQEAVVNIGRHADAQNAFIFLEARADAFRIGIEDDGMGFDVHGAIRNVGEDRGKGFGLLGMKERVALLGGDMKICSNLEEGTFVSVQIPLKAIGGSYA